MEEHGSWVLEVAIKPGEIDSYEALMQEMVEGTRTEPRTLNYEWYKSEDGSIVHLFEKYADSDAMIAHVSGFLETWAARFMACVDVTRFTVYGNPSAPARELLAAFGPTYLGPWGRFARS